MTCRDADTPTGHHQRGLGVLQEFAPAPDSWGRDCDRARRSRDQGSCSRHHQNIRRCGQNPERRRNLRWFAANGLYGRPQRPWPICANSCSSLGAEAKSSVSHAVWQGDKEDDRLPGGGVGPYCRAIRSLGVRASSCQPGETAHSVG